MVFRKRMFYSLLLGGSLLCAAGCGSLCHKEKEPEIKFIAHRGESALAPENTMPAFRTAWKNGAAWAVETDVYQSKDGQIVCLHDGSLERVTQGASKENVQNLTVEEIKKFDVGSWKGEEFAGETVPLLAEVFEQLPENGRIFLEIKIGGENFPAKLKELMKTYGIKQEQIVVISFSANELIRINKEFPGFKTNLLCGIGTEEETGKPKRSAAELIQTLAEIGATGVDAGAVGSIDAAYVKAVKDAGYEFHVWTIDNVDDAKRLHDIGADSITTNRPTYLRDNWPQDQQ